MASLHKDSRTGKWRVIFRWSGVQHTKSCRTSSTSGARAIKARIDETINLLSAGRIDLPENVDPANWIFTGGKTIRNGKPHRKQNVRLGPLCDAYLSNQLGKAHTTIAAEKIHIRHLKRYFGETTVVTKIASDDIQKYVSQRLSQSYRNRPISGTTVRKELVTFRQIWIWAQDTGMVSSHCPLLRPNGKWLVSVPKSKQRKKFQTWAQIVRRIDRGGLSKDQQKDIWSGLYLDQDQVHELLEFVKRMATHDFIYPMFVIAAYTGARRSEILRSCIDDFDFSEMRMLIRERKRRKDLAESFRFVPIHPKLKTEMLAWFDIHPGGQRTLTVPEQMPGQRPRPQAVPLSPCAATHHFKYALRNSKWSVVRGFHVLRHSFGSNLARSGKVPTNVIAQWMGHTTAEMQELYQHLFPQDGEEQIAVLR